MEILSTHNLPFHKFSAVSEFCRRFATSRLNYFSNLRRHCTTAICRL